MDIISYILSKKYTDETAAGMGSLKGAAATIKSIEKVDGVSTVTFEWIDKNGVSQTSDMEVKDGEKGTSVSLIIDENEHMIVEYSDGTTEDIGEIPKQKIAISKDAGNGIDMREDGIYMSATGVDLSQEEGNILEAKEDGLYAAAPDIASTTDDITYKEEVLTDSLEEIETNLDKKYEKPEDGIPAEDLAEGVIPTNLEDERVETLALNTSHGWWNVWDGSWEPGYYSKDGTKSEFDYSTTYCIRCSDFIKIKPNTDYFIHNPKTSGMMIYFYNEDKQYISEKLIGQFTNGNYTQPKTYTSPDNASFLLFYTNGRNYGHIFKNDIYINEGNHSEQVPFVKSVKTLTENTEKIKDIQYGHYSGGKNICPIDSFEADTSYEIILNYDNFPNSKSVVLSAIVESETIHSSGCFVEFYQKSGPTTIAYIKSNTGNRTSTDTIMVSSPSLIFEKIKLYPGPSSSETSSYNKGKHFSFKDIQLEVIEYWETSTEYEPYIKSLKQLTEESENIASKLDKENPAATGNFKLNSSMMVDKNNNILNGYDKNIVELPSSEDIKDNFIQGANVLDGKSVRNIVSGQGIGLIDSSNSVGTGFMHFVAGSNNLIGGSKNRVNGGNSIVAGTENVSTSANQLVIGKYNDFGENLIDCYDMTLTEYKVGDVTYNDEGVLYKCIKDLDLSTVHVNEEGYPVNGDEEIIELFPPTIETKIDYEKEGIVQYWKKWDGEGKYAFTIGNGTGVSEDNRSNAMTVDWDGNLEIGGNIISNDVNINTELTNVKSGLSDLAYGEIGSRNLWNKNPKFVNEISDSRTNFQAYVQLYKDNTYINLLANTTIATTGRTQISFRVTNDGNRIVLKHNGSRADITIGDLYISEGEYVISFDVNGYNPTVIGGLSLSNIQVEKGSQSTPYVPYIAQSVKSLNDSLKEIGKCKNLLNPILQTSTANGITVTNNGDGTYTVNGTNTSTWNFFGFSRFEATENITVKYIGYKGNARFFIWDATANKSVGYADATNGIYNFEKNHNYDIGLLFQQASVVCDNILVKPMLTTNLNVTYDDFAPYTGDGDTLMADIRSLKADLISKPAASEGTALSLVTTGEKAAWNAKTSNTGTVTSVSVKMNGSVKGTVTSSGTIDLGNVGGISSENPTATGSFSLNRLEDSTVGDSSSTFGYDCTASASCSHAEGVTTKATKMAAHAEGYNTTAKGEYSHSEGYESVSQGNGSHAEGMRSKSIGSYSHAEGSLSNSFGEDSHAEGCRTAAYGDGSHAEGYSSNSVTSYIQNLDEATLDDITSVWEENKFTLAYGFASHTEGLDTLALSSYAHAEGNQSVALEINSHAEGNQSVAWGENSHAEGNQSSAWETNSHAEGSNTEATNFASHASGKYNTQMTTGGSISNITGTAFVIGNGTSNVNKSNAFSVQYDGTVKAKSTITASITADYAEFFEWLDENPQKEDRVGHFVTLDGDKIRIATNEDDYILGVISGEPFVLGNGDCDVWNGMYLHDEFRRTMTEPAPKMVEVLDENGKHTGKFEEVKGEFEGTRFVLNPDYDPEKPYVSRFDRPEWSPVGMLGVLPVIHDGTAKVNGYVTVNENGIATICNKNDENSYRVIKSNSDNVVEIIFR